MTDQSAPIRQPELIFNNSRDDNVDLEIILFGPSDKDLKRQTRLIDLTSTGNDISSSSDDDKSKGGYLEEFDPLAKQATRSLSQQQIDNEPQKSTKIIEPGSGPETTLRAKSEDEREKKNRKSLRKLIRMERKFKKNKAPAESEGASVDYLDYF